MVDERRGEPLGLIDDAHAGGKVTYAVEGDSLMDPSSASKPPLLDKRRFKPEIVVKVSVVVGGCCVSLVVVKGCG